MKRILQVLAAFLLLAATGAATTTAYALIGGTVDVDGPILYTAPATALSLNDAPSAGTYNLSTDDTVSFTSDQLDELTLYPVAADLSLTARTNTTANITAAWRFTNSTGTYTLCNTTFYLASDTYETYTDTCTGSAIPTNIQRFHYRITTTSDKTGIVQLKTGEPTRIEVDAQ